MVEMRYVELRGFYDRDAKSCAAGGAGLSRRSAGPWVWTASHADITVVLPDEAMERESIYADRGV